MIDSNFPALEALRQILDLCKDSGFNDGGPIAQIADLTLNTYQRQTKQRGAEIDHVDQVTIKMSRDAAISMNRMLEDRLVCALDAGDPLAHEIARATHPELLIDDD